MSTVTHIRTGTKRATLDSIDRPKTRPRFDKLGSRLDLIPHRSNGCSPTPTTESYPRVWCSPELTVDSTCIPPLPRLPDMDHASQVFLHKSAIGRIASRNMEYEGTSYKPLEFFGDAAIEFQVSRVLMNDFPGRGPGLLTWLRGRMVDNRTLGVLGWGCGLAPLIKFGKDPHLNANGGRNVSQSIVSEVFEAYIGALALDPASNTALCEWFDRVFSKNSAVFPRLQEEASTRLGHMKETVVRKTTAKEAHNAVRNGKLTAAELICDCFTGTKCSTLFKYEDQDCSFNVGKGGGVWHTVLTGADGERLACGAGDKRLDAREEAWASALASARKLV